MERGAIFIFIAIAESPHTSRACGPVGWMERVDVAAGGERDLGNDPRVRGDLFANKF
jgi:hypothetical protein